MALTRAPPGRSCWVRRRPRRADHRPAAGHRDAIFAGLRAHELEALQWRHVNLAAGRITVGESKTAADAYREIDLLPILRDELAAHKAASARTRPYDLVFTTRTGAPRDRYNLRQRVVLP